MSLSKTFYPLLVTVQPRDIGNCPDMTENCQLGHKASTQSNLSLVLNPYASPDGA